MKFAHVTDLGTLRFGNATTASRQASGDYLVTFAEDVSRCAATVTTGINTSAGTPGALRAAIGLTTVQAGRTVIVRLVNYTAGLPATVTSTPQYFGSP